jgi:hypothetical protein
VTLYDANTLVEDQVLEPTWASNTVARRGQRLIEGDEYGRVQVWDLAANPPRLLDYADLRVLTGHTGSEDIEIRGVWTDSIDNLVFAGSDWGNNQSRSASLPAFFVLELVEDPLTASITSPPSGATVSGTVTITMSAGNAQGAPTQFVLTLDNAATLASQSVSGSTATYAWNTAGVASGAHTLNLTVTDGTGQSATAAISVTVSAGDTTPPAVTITSPAGGAWTGNSIAVTASASDAGGLVNIKLWGGGAVFGTIPCTGTTCSGTVTWITGPLAPAAYQAQAVATDAAGNCGLSTPVTINKDATAPVVPSGATCGGAPPPPGITASITSPPNGATVSGTSSAVSLAVSNVQAPTQFVLKLDNTTTLYNQGVSGATASTTWNTTSTPNGTHTLTFTATDAAGKAATASVSVTVANPTSGTPPTVSVTSPASGAWTGNSIEIKATASSGAALTNLKFWGNGAVFATVPCSTTSCLGDVWWVTGPLAPAAYQVQVVATDSAGKSATSAPVTIYKDATAPMVPSGAGGGTPPPALTASITSPPDAATVSGTSSGVSLAVSNAQAPTQLVLKLDNTTPLYNQSVSGTAASTTWNTTTTANGPHTLDLTATDAAGRTATASVSITVSNGTSPGDTTPPTVTITKPSNGAWTGNSIDVTATGGDNVAVATLTYYGDGTQFAQVACGGTASCTSTQWWLTGSLASGQHTITVVATDSSGNQTTSAPVVINK